MSRRQQQFQSEVVSIGTECIGRIRETNRGFELFDGDDQYLCTAVTLAEARRVLFQRHKEQAEAVHG